MTDFTVTTPHLTQLPPEASKKGNWGVFLFTKQKETKTIFIPDEAILNLETKRGTHGAQGQLEAGVLGSSQQKLCSESEASSSFLGLVSKGIPVLTKAGGASDKK